MKKAVHVDLNENTEYLLRQLKAAGYREVAISFYNSQDFVEDNWEHKVEELAKLLEQYHLDCFQTHLPCPYNSVTTSSEEQDPVLEQAVQRAVAASAKLGAEWCVCHPRAALNFCCDPVRALEDNRRAISGYLETARKVGTGVAIENMPVTPYEPKLYCADYLELIELVDSFADDSLKACWDFGHGYTVYREKMPEALAAMGNQVRCVHISDNDGPNDSHLAPWDGNIDWEKAMGQLGAQGYRGNLTMESLYRVKSPMLENHLHYYYECLSQMEKLVYASANRTNGIRSGNG